MVEIAPTPADYLCGPIFQYRTADSRAGTRKTMIVALARKLLIALWRFVTTGETLEGVISRPAG